MTGVFRAYPFRLKQSRDNVVQISMKTVHRRGAKQPLRHVMAIKFKLWDHPQQPVVYQYKRFKTAQDMYSTYKAQWYLFQNNTDKTL